MSLRSLTTQKSMAGKSDLLKTSPGNATDLVSTHGHAADLGAGQELTAVPGAEVVAVPEVPVKIRNQRADLPVVIVRNQNLHLSRAHAQDPGQGQDQMKRIMVMMIIVMTEIMTIKMFSYFTVIFFSLRLVLKH